MHAIFMNSPRNVNITSSVISPYAKVYVRKNKRRGAEVGEVCGHDSGEGSVTNFAKLAKLGGVLRGGITRSVRIGRVQGLSNALSYLVFTIFEERDITLIPSSSSDSI